MRLARERVDRVRAGRHAGLLHELRALELALAAQRSRRTRRSRLRAFGNVSRSARPPDARARRATNVTPKTVSTRVVNTSIRASTFSTVERERRRLRCVRSSCAAWCGCVRASRQPVEAFEQPIRVVGDLEVPLREVAPLDGRAAAPAAPVLDLLVGEHRLIDRAPVHRRFALVRQAVLEHAARRTTGSSGSTRDRRSQTRASSRSPCPSAGSGGACSRCSRASSSRVDPALDRGVLGRQAERVPAHRVHDVVAAHAHACARSRRRGCSSCAWPDVQIARGIRQHLEHVVLRARVVVARDVDALALPALLPRALDGAKIVTPLVGHPPCLLRRGAGPLCPRLPAPRAS